MGEIDFTAILKVEITPAIFFCVPAWSCPRRRNRESIPCKFSRQGREDCHCDDTGKTGLITYWSSVISSVSISFAHCLQNTTSHDKQLQHLVYLLENAISNLPEEQEQMVWLIDFNGWSLSNSTPIKTAREATNILQNHYPERLATAFLYNPPRIFETFWKVRSSFKSIINSSMCLSLTNFTIFVFCFVFEDCQIFPGSYDIPEGEIYLPEERRNCGSYPKKLRRRSPSEGVWREKWHAVQPRRVLQVDGKGRYENGRLLGIEWEIKTSCQWTLDFRNHTRSRAFTASRCAC